MFQDVSDEYDLLNRLLTFGLDRRWRARATTSCLEDSPGAILDLCCGTGDLLFTILRRAHGGSRVLGLDFTEAMIGRASMAAGRSKPLVLADAGHLPFRGESFDCVAIAFSFRNLLYKNPAIDRYLAEVLRVPVKSVYELPIRRVQLGRRRIRCRRGCPPHPPSR